VRLFLTTPRTTRGHTTVPHLLISRYLTRLRSKTPPMRRPAFDASITNRRQFKVINWQAVMGFDPFTTLFLLSLVHTNTPKRSLYYSTVRKKSTYLLVECKTLFMSTVVDGNKFVKNRWPILALMTRNRNLILPDVYATIQSTSVTILKWKTFHFQKLASSDHRATG
jgi:hypothetical protein